MITDKIQAIRDGLRFILITIGGLLFLAGLLLLPVAMNTFFGA